MRDLNHILGVHAVASEKEVNVERVEGIGFELPDMHTLLSEILVAAAMEVLIRAHTDWVGMKSKELRQEKRGKKT